MKKHKTCRGCVALKRGFCFTTCRLGEEIKWPKVKYGRQKLLRHPMPIRPCDKTTSHKKLAKLLNQQ